jgi:hypothetical protein
MCGGFFFGLGLPGGARKAQPGAVLGRIMSVAGTFSDNLLGGGGYNRKKVSMLRSNTAIL